MCRRHVILRKKYETQGRTRIKHPEPFKLCSSLIPRRPKSRSNHSSTLCTMTLAHRPWQHMFLRISPMRHRNAGLIAILELGITPQHIEHHVFIDGRFPQNSRTAYEITNAPQNHTNCHKPNTHTIPIIPTINMT